MMTKLQSEVASRRKQLKKRQEYCSKPAEKQKQTETLLMSVLSGRRRDLDDWSSAIHRIRTTTFTSCDEIKLTVKSEEVQSLCFKLEQHVENKVKAVLLCRQDEEKIGEYSADMRQLVTLVKEHEALRRESNDSSDSSRIRYVEQSIEGVELKIELLRSYLGELRTQVSKTSKVVEGGSNQMSFEKLVHATAAPVLRTLLLDELERRSASEVCAPSVSDVLTVVSPSEPLFLSL
jgi:hypothetical protein